MSKTLDLLGPFSPFGLSSLPTGSSQGHNIDGAKYFLFESFDSQQRLQSTLSQDAKNENLYVGSQQLNQCLSAADGVFSSITGEEEVVVMHKTVVWSSGGAVKKSFTLEKPIIQAMVVHFKSTILSSQNLSSSEENAQLVVPSDLCVLHSDGLRVFCADGKTYSVVTPYEMERMWPLPVGLILQRASKSLASTVASVHGMFLHSHQNDSDLQSLEDEIPTLFSLLHPLEEVKPLCFFNSKSCESSNLVPQSSSLSTSNSKNIPTTPTFPNSRTTKSSSQSSTIITSSTTNNTFLEGLERIHNTDTQEVMMENSPTTTTVSSPTSNSTELSDEEKFIFICEPDLRMIYSSAEVPLIVLYNQKTKLHSIWLVRRDKAVPSLLHDSQSSGSNISNHSGKKRSSSLILTSSKNSNNPLTSTSPWIKKSMGSSKASPIGSPVMMMRSTSPSASGVLPSSSGLTSSNSSFISPRPHHTSSSSAEPPSAEPIITNSGDSVLFESFKAGYHRDIRYQDSSQNNGGKDDRQHNIIMKFISDIFIEHIFTEAPRPVNSNSVKTNIVSEALEVPTAAIPSTSATFPIPKASSTIPKAGPASPYEGSEPASHVFLICTSEADLVLCFMFETQKRVQLYQLAHDTRENSQSSAASGYRMPVDSESNLSAGLDSSSSSYSKFIPKPLTISKSESIPCLSAVPLKVMDSILINVNSHLIRLSPCWVMLDLDNKMALYSLHQKICNLVMPGEEISEEEAELEVNEGNHGKPYRSTQSTISTPINTQSHTPLTSVNVPIPSTPSSAIRLVHRTPSRTFNPPLSHLQQHGPKQSESPSIAPFGTPLNISNLKQQQQQKLIIYSPMNPGSPFAVGPTSSSQMDLSLSNMDMDLSIDSYLMETPASMKKQMAELEQNAFKISSPAPPLSFQTPLKHTHVPQKSTNNVLEDAASETVIASSPFQPPGTSISAPSYQQSKASSSSFSSSSFLSASSQQQSQSQSTCEEPQLALKILEVLQPVSNRFCILYSDGSILRVSLKLSPSSPLVNDCLRVTSCILPTDAWNVLLSDLAAWNWKTQQFLLDDWNSFSLYLKSLCLAPKITSSTITTQQGGRESRKKDTKLFGTQVSLPLTQSSPPDDDDWEFLLKSEFHQSKSLDPSLNYLISVVNSIQNLATDSEPTPEAKKNQSSSIPNTASIKNDDIENIVFGEDAISKICFQRSKVDHLSSLATDWRFRNHCRSLQPFLSRILHSLHLLCENYKLSTLTIKNSKDLCQVLLEIAHFMDGWEHYVTFYRAYLEMDSYSSISEHSGKAERQGQSKHQANIFSTPIANKQFHSSSSLPPKSPALASSLPMDQHPPLPFPPSIYHWMHRCLKGVRESFPMFHQSNPPCELSRKICRIYHILCFGNTHGEDKLATYFEPFGNLPVEMGSRLHKTPKASPVKSAHVDRNQNSKWNVRARLAVLSIEEEFGSVGDLEHLAFGVALPLKEAIFTVRHKPPFNWPLNYYHMIGRDDLALQSTTMELLEKRKYTVFDPSAESSPYSSTANAHQEQLLADGNPSSSSASSLTATSHQISNLLSRPFDASAVFGSTNSSINGYNPTNPPPADPSTWPISSAIVYSLSDHAMGSAVPGLSNPSASNASSFQKSSYDGTSITSRSCLMRFSSDERLIEACKILSSNHPILLTNTEEISHMSDADQIYAKQALHMRLALRQVSFPVGRGALALSAEVDHLPGPISAIQTPLSQPSSKILNNQHVSQTSSHSNVNSNSPGSQKFSTRTELFPIPPVCLHAKQPDSKASIPMDPHASDLISVWTDFHNAVASGLRIAPSYVEQVTMSWIGSHKPNMNHINPASASLDPSIMNALAAHAGFLFAMGLQGHFQDVNAIQLYDYLSMGNPITVSSVLISACIGHYGTRSSVVSNSLIPYFPNPIVTPKNDETSWTLAYSSAAIGTGLLFAETCDRHRVETLLSQLANNQKDRESYALSCGIGLGFVCLGKGSTAFGLSDLDLVNRLSSFIDGKSQVVSQSSASNHSSYLKNRSTFVAELSSNARISNNFGLLYSHAPSYAPNTYVYGDATVSSSPPSQLSHFEKMPTDQPLIHIGGVDIAFPPPTISKKSSQTTSTSAKASHLQHHDLVHSVATVRNGASGHGVNKYLSGPGAILALAFIYLKTNDAFVAKRLELPSASTMDLAYVRPDMQILRVLARNLTLWDSIEANNEFIEGQLCNGSLKAINSLLLPVHTRDLAEEKTESFQLLKVAYICVLTGCMMSIGLKFAGTHDEKALLLLMNQFGFLIKLQKVLSSWSDKYLIDTSINQCILAMSIVMCGSGDIRVLRIARKYRQKIGLDPKKVDNIYGSHMAKSMAIGFLFLGGGRYAFSRSNKSIACLVCSIYPVFPIHPIDDLRHLPLLRHFYVLAAENRFLEARNVDTLNPVFIPIQLTLSNEQMKHSQLSNQEYNVIQRRSQRHANDAKKDQHQKYKILKLNAPCLLPPFETIEKLELLCPNHWRSSFHPPRNSHHMNVLKIQHCILVKPLNTNHGRIVGSLNNTKHSVPLKSANLNNVFNFSHLRLSPTNPSNTENSQSHNQSIDMQLIDSTLNYFKSNSKLSNLADVLTCHDTEQLEYLTHQIIENDQSLSNVSGDHLASMIQQKLFSSFEDHNHLIFQLLNECNSSDKMEILPLLLWMNTKMNQEQQKQRNAGRYKKTNGDRVFNPLECLNIDLLLAFYQQGISEDFVTSIQERRNRGKQRQLQDLGTGAASSTSASESSQAKLLSVRFIQTLSAFYSTQIATISSSQ